LKLLVFAHKPPPHHGQSFMVGMVLKVLGTPTPNTSNEIQIFHVDARLSDELSDVGRAGFLKVFRLLRFCVQAIFYRFRYGANALYYVPAPPHRVAILRDWIALGLCRPFFKTTIYHWHASGMGQWLRESAKPWERLLTSWTIMRPDLSIILRPANRSDVEVFQSGRIAVVPYGISDPSPQFETEIRPRRIARSTARVKLLGKAKLTAAERSSADGDPEVFRILFMSLCVREKGLFDLIEAIALLGPALAGSDLRVELLVAGSFVTDSERLEFDQRIVAPDFARGNVSVRYCGFAGGVDKEKLLAEADCFCFPTYYEAESFGLVLLEAMAFGLPVITSNWRSTHELFPPNYPWVAPPRSPREIAVHLLRIAETPWDDSLRRLFLEAYSEDKFATNIRAAISSAAG